MTKKKTLSPTASLATCLDFAARVLSSTASVQEIYTKPVLAPMVIEAHRYGRQATKHLEPGTPADVRKLLKVLQSNNLGQASPLAKLDVADLTWDFEGTVADTLEMELEELTDRAAMNTTDTCVVFSASTPVSIGGQAVIWFPLKPHEDLRDEDDRRSAMKKQQILLYVCPGRVKVVKSVGDLVKKLYDELPSIRENDALYSVWAVFKNDTRIDNQKERQAPSTVMKDCMVSQFAVDQGLNSPADFTASVSANLETTKHHNSAKLSARPKQTRCDENRRSMTESMNNHAEDTVGEDSPEGGPQPQHNAHFDQEKLPPLSPRFTVYQGANWYAPDNKISTDLELASSEHLPDDLEVGKRSVENVDGNDMKSEKNTTSCTDDNQTQVPWKRRHVISSSVPNFSAERHLDYDVGMDLGVRLQQGLAWQSCDGKVLRSSVRSQLVIPATDNGSEEFDELSDVNNQHDNEDNVGDYEAAENEATASIDEVTEVETSQLESSEQFPDTVLLEQAGSLDDGGTSIFRFGYDIHKENDRQANGGWLPPEMTASTKMPTNTQSADHFDASGIRQITSSNYETDDVIPVEPNDDKVESSDLPIQTEEIVPPPKPKSAPVNYKDKLGARVWWELEYTARKLEREEMMERRQQARHHQVDSRTTTTSGASRQKFAHHLGPQRREPTGWSKRFRPEKESEVSVSIDESADNGLKQRISDVGVAFVPELIEEMHEISEIASSTTKGKAMATQATLSHNQQGNEKQETDKPPSEVLPSPSVQKSIRDSKDTYSLNEKNEAIKQAAASRTSVEISTSGNCSEIAQDLPVQEDSDLERDVLDPSTIPPSETIFLPSVQKSLRGSKDVYSLNKDPEAMTQLARTLENLTSRNYREVAHNLPGQEDRELERAVFASSTLQKSSPHLCVRLSKANECLSNELEGSRQSLKCSSTSKSTTYSLLSRSGVRGGSKVNDSINKEDDEAVAQTMWGSTHTSYETDRTMLLEQIAGNEATESTPALPFTVRGRVPIRIHRDPTKVVIPAEAEAQKSVSNSSVSASSPLRGLKTLPNENPSRIKPSELPQSTADVQTTPRVPTPTPVATFIPLGEDTSRSPRAPTESRQQRLNELRQKKLRKLQQTRDLSLQQHKEKQHQRQIQRPLSFASSVYSKKASNRQLMQNALEFTLLAGGSMEKERALALQALAESTCDNFIVLLKSAKELKFRALYENHVERDSATRIYSVLPSNSSRAPLKLGGSEVISQFFKYSSAKKQFLPVPTRSFTVKTDACALVEQLVFKGKSKSAAIARLL